MDVIAWLERQGLAQYGPAFEANHIDAATLRALTDADLKELGVASLGHRKRLRAAIAALGEAAAPPAADEGERREATVLFADLSGYTALTAALGAEQTHALLNQLFDAIDGVVVAHGGVVDKHIGDAVMAVFGAPRAHDDDPERALRAAAAIHAAVAEVGRAAGRRLRVHIGIASGPVVASRTGSDRHQEYTVIGEAVNLAARLQDLAGPGETLIAERVRQAAGAWLQAEPAARPGLQAVTDAPVWLVAGIDGAPAAGHLPLVGRRAELARFGVALQDCRARGTGLLLALRGEPGIGKSRLLAEFQAIAAAAGVTGLAVPILDFGGARARDPAYRVVCGLLGLDHAAGEPARGAAVAQAVADGLIAPPEQPYLCDLLHLPPPTAFRVAYETMAEATRQARRRALLAGLMERRLAAGPMLLAIDDLHWATPAMLADLAALAGLAAHAPLLVAATARIDATPVALAGPAVPVAAIELGPLAPAEAEALAVLFGAADQRLLAEAVARAEGHPLFLEQLLRHAEGQAGAALPGSLQSAVLARLDRLPPADRQALQAAAVLGQRFTLDALRALVEQPGYTAARLVAHHLVRAEGDELAFVHSLVRQGIYGALLDRRRAELHRRAAAWFAERDPVLRAQHLDRAGDPEAALVYLQAAHVQSAAWHDAQALELVERGLAIATAPVDRAALVALQAKLLLDLGRAEAAIQAWREALELAHDERQRCAAWIGLAAAMRLLDQLATAQDALDQAEAIATRHCLLTELARLHHLRGNLYFPLGRVAECREEHLTALDYARQAGALELEAEALGGLADAASLQARIGAAQTYFHRAIVIARANGFGRIEVANQPMRGIMRYYQNDLAGAAEDCLAGAEAAATVGHQRAELLAHAAAAFILMEQGELAAAGAQADMAIAQAERLGARRFEASAWRHRGRILAAAGDPAAGLAALLRSYQIARDAGPGFAGPWALGGIAVLTADPEQRRWALAEGERLLAEGSPFQNHFWFRRDAIEACLAGGDWAEAERHAGLLEAFTAAEPVAWTSFVIARGRALAAAGQGRADPAELRRLEAEAARAGLVLLRPALAAALAGCAQADGR